MSEQTGKRRIRIAHLSGPNATIQNIPPLVTSNKARQRHGLPLLTDVEGQPQRYDALRAQKLAAPVVVYVEQFSAHPLERDSAGLYDAPDGYVDAGGSFHEERQSDADRPVYRIELCPDDGYYPLPYMARQKGNRPWDTDGTGPFSARDEARQPFMPDGSRLFEEVDRLGVDARGHGNAVGNLATVDFYRVAPSGGYLGGLAGDERTDRGEGHIDQELPGRDFFPYRPPHLHVSPSRAVLADITNAVQRVLSSSDYDGAIWTQGSPRIEETVYWFNLALDIAVPLCGCASQRYHGQISNDGPKNLADAVEYMESRCWADQAGFNHAGVVLVQDQRVFAAREVAKVDARPGGYVATGGLGGIIGSAGYGGPARLHYVPTARHTRSSEVNITRLPREVMGMGKIGDDIGRIPVAIKDSEGYLVATAIPKVAIVKDSSYAEDDFEGDPAQEVDVIALMDAMYRVSPLSGFVLEGLNPYGKPASSSKARILARAVYSGFPVVIVGRGNTEGFPVRAAPYIAGSNLTATKARMLLMLCLMKFGTMPMALNPSAPSQAEKEATRRAIKLFQDVFDTH